MEQVIFWIALIIYRSHDAIADRSMPGYSTSIDPEIYLGICNYVRAIPQYIMDATEGDSSQ